MADNQPQNVLLKTDKNMFLVLTNVPNETGCSAIACLKNLLSEALKRPKTEPPTGINISYRPANCSPDLNYMLTWDELGSMHKLNSMGDKILHCFAL